LPYRDPETLKSFLKIIDEFKAALENKIREILRIVNEIQVHSKPVIEYAYREFLLQSSNPDEREYPDESDQIREVLIHSHYMSRRDIDICLHIDMTNLRERAEFPEIEALHQKLHEGYADNDDAAA
jgi:hypothetical protein